MRTARIGHALTQMPHPVQRSWFTFHPVARDPSTAPWGHTRATGQTGDRSHIIVSIEATYKVAPPGLVGWH